MFLWGGVFINALVGETQLQQSCFQRAFQETYNGNHQQLQFVLHWIQKIQRNVLLDGHQLLETVHSVLQLFYQSNQPLQLWLYMFLLLQSYSIHWVIHPAACVQEIYVICSSKGIWWYWGIYLHRGEINRWVIEWPGTWVEFRHTNNDFEYCNR